MKNLNDKQKENLATFYNNLALVLLTAGVVTPIFNGVENNYFSAIIKLSLGVLGTGFFLKFSLNYLK